MCHVLPESKFLMLAATGPTVFSDFRACFDKIVQSFNVVFQEAKLLVELMIESNCRRPDRCHRTEQAGLTLCPIGLFPERFNSLVQLRPKLGRHRWGNLAFVLFQHVPDVLYQVAGGAHSSSGRLFV